MVLTRADWITIAVTLILFGVAYYLSGPKAALTCLALGILILVVIMFFKRDKRPPDRPSQSVQQTANPSITHNPTQTVNVNVDTQPPTQPTPVAPSTEPEPNIHFVGARAIDAYAKENALYETQDKLGDFRLAIACFRNDAIVGQRIQQPEVKAHIVYKDADGQEITDVPRGAWMETHKDHIYAAIGKKSCLILLLLTKQGTLKKLWRESYFHEHRWMSGQPSFHLKDAAIRGKIASIEILLLSEGAAILQTILDVGDYSDGELPKLTVPP